MPFDWCMIQIGCLWRLCQKLIVNILVDWRLILIMLFDSLLLVGVLQAEGHSVVHISFTHEPIRSSLRCCFDLLWKYLISFIPTMLSMYGSSALPRKLVRSRTFLLRHHRRPSSSLAFPLQHAWVSSFLYSLLLYFLLELVIDCWKHWSWRRICSDLILFFGWHVG